MLGPVLHFTYNSLYNTRKEIVNFFWFFFKILFIYFQRKGGKKEGEKYQCLVASRTPPAEDLVCNPGMCPDWESNRQPFLSQTGGQSIEPHQPGLLFLLDT